jgi:DNA-binding NarL/FixJ family response regulator
MALDQIRILIVDDQALFAEGLSSILRQQGMPVVGVARTGREGVALASQTHPDTVLVDISLPDVSGLVAGRRILEEHPEVRVIALTGLPDRTSIHEAMASGFHGYVLKTGSFTELVGAIQATTRSHVVIPEASVESIVNSSAPLAQDEEKPQDDGPLSQLTDRERQILGLLAEGANGRQIAGRLFLSPNTVRTHIQNMLGKLRVHSRLEAVALAVAHGLRGPSDSHQEQPSPLRGKRLS